ncbi:unnamed protein product, partial [Chrysoparadoxa australica]
VAWFSGGAFVLLCFPITMKEIYLHLTHWHMPHVQKYVVRILWMVPFYAVESWLSLRFREVSLYLEALRECYEAYVIFCFLYFLIGLLGDEQTLAATLKSKDSSHGRHPWPFRWLFQPWKMGQSFLGRCKFGVLQVSNLPLIPTSLPNHLSDHQGQWTWHGGY